MKRKPEHNPENYRTVCNRVRGRCAFALLRDLTHASKNLYNLGLYTVRQHFFDTESFLPYGDVYKQLKDSDAYKSVHSQMGQQILKKVHQDFSSFFGALRAKLAGRNNREVNIPRYKPTGDDGFFSVYLSKDCFQKQGSRVRVSLPKWIQKKYDQRFLWLDLPPQIADMRLVQVEIIPDANGRFFRAAFTYDAGEPEIPPKAEEERYASIDLGLNIIASLLDAQTGQSWLFSGGYAKSVNQLYNKELSRLKSCAERCNGKKVTRRIVEITRKRNARIKDHFHKLALRIATLLDEQGITCLVIGHNKEQKNGINIGKKNNQKFVQIPHQLLVQYLRDKCSRLGIRIEMQEEAHTSKCDALALEEVQHHDSYLGRRIIRGLFRSSTGVVLHADLNGCLNILRKYIRKCKRESLVAFEQGIQAIASSGRVFRPVMVEVFCSYRRAMTKQPS